MTIVIARVVVVSTAVSSRVRIIYARTVVIEVVAVCIYIVYGEKATSVAHLYGAEIVVQCHEASVFRVGQDP